MTTETVAERIARLRRARGWTQYDLAAEVGVARYTVSRWETGIHAVNSNGHRRLLGAAFDADPRDFAGEHDDR